MLLRDAYRITTFVPPQQLDAVLQAIIAKGPLTYGPYDKSAWWSAVGTEQFEPRAGANPTVGEIGTTERVPTVRLEFVIPREAELLNRVVEALLEAHPWQEPAVFIDATEITVSNPT
jgi:hypothetical protein